MKSYNNTDDKTARRNVPDIELWGATDFKLISKASSLREKWMKSTKAMEIPGAGCVIQVTTQQGHNIAEALTFVPSVGIQEFKDSTGLVVNRKIVCT